MEILGENNFTSVTRPKNLSSQIEEQLLKVINKGVFAIGDYLPSEKKLVEIFNVSRGVIREALLMLSAKGIIEIQKGKGAIVLNPSIESILDPFSSLVNYKCGNNGFRCSEEVRIIIEPQIASIAAKLRKEENLKKLKHHYNDMEKYIDDKKMFNFYDIEFHKTVSLSSGNPMFSMILEPIFHFLQTYHRETLEGLISNEITLDFHHKILNAIEEKNSKEAYNAMYQHLTVGQKEANKLLAD
ncbi:MAG: FadR family transcriptional regulator [Cyclobacteriaceae bacterium]|nr:FadR family transcriptional regulator [Cyclobacteriaceae bacterium]